jgi:putative nucleotidyltransferase with HDIG domain
MAGQAVAERGDVVRAAAASAIAGVPATESGEPDLAAWVAAALEAALYTRAPGVHASTPLVRQLALKVSRQAGLDAHGEALLDLAVRVRDVGMLGLPDNVVLVTTALSPADWELVNQHPALGEKVLVQLSVVASAAQIVRAHHERWDGGGYPDASQGEAIPVLSRVIATCDAFVAMASDRPHRRGIGAEVALEHVCQERGAQFDPQMVDALVAVLSGTRVPRARKRGAIAARAASRDGEAVQRSPRGPHDLAGAIAEFDVVPAFAPAHERVLAASTANNMSPGELVAAIECDIGLTVAVLRRAQSISSRAPIANVADAVAALGAADIEETIVGLPRAEFPWRTSQLEVLMHHSRVHAQAVARAADRIVREVNPSQRDDVLAAALLHDIGKLVLGRALPEYDSTTERTTTPERRVRQEQQAWGMDHASLGGVLLRRWGLPKGLVSTVASHHSAEANNELATYVRLADMVAHQAQGDHVDRAGMLRSAHVCGMSAHMLRDVLFDLPHSGGSQRRRAEPSSLSRRETAVLRVLAQGKVYKVIAIELGMATSTVRTHLHNVYAKLGVDDRAQAVLRATEMGWI